MTNTKIISILLVFVSQSLLTGLEVNGCRIASEKLTKYATTRIERLLDPTTLSLLYWEDEPLDPKSLSKATGLNVTLAETKFDLDDYDATKPNDVKKESNFIEDLFIACFADKGRQNVLAINLELTNPFKRIEISFIPDDASLPVKFHLDLQQSSFLTQLTQQLGYVECLHINYVQLTSNVEYLIECDECTDSARKQLDRMFKKRISHLDAELCNLLSDKLMYGLRNLLDQERMDLE